MELAIPKTNSKKDRQAKKDNRKKWEAKCRRECYKLAHDRCEFSFMFANADNLLQDQLDWCHLIPRDKHHPEYDTPEYTIILRRFIHDQIDGRTRNGMDLTAKDFKIHLLERKKEFCEKYSKPFRHEKVLRILKGERK